MNIIEKEHLTISDTKLLSQHVGSALDRISTGEYKLSIPLAQYLDNKSSTPVRCGLTDNPNHVINTASFISLLKGSNYDNYEDLYQDYYKNYYIYGSGKKFNKWKENVDKYFSNEENNQKLLKDIAIYILNKYNNNKWKKHKEDIISVLESKNNVDKKKNILKEINNLHHNSSTSGAPTFNTKVNLSHHPIVEELAIALNIAKL